MACWRAGKWAGAYDESRAWIVNCGVTPKGRNQLGDLGVVKMQIIVCGV